MGQIYGIDPLASIARSPVGTDGLMHRVHRTVPNTPGSYETGMSWEWALHVRTQCRYTHPSIPEGIERVVTPSAVLLAHHPRTVSHLTFELGPQCPTIPAFSALSHCEVVVLLSRCSRNV